MNWGMASVVVAGNLENEIQKLKEQIKSLEARIEDLERKLI